MTTEALNESAVTEHDADGVIMEDAIEITEEPKLPAFNDGPVAHKLPALSDRQSAFLPISVADINAVSEMLESLPGTRPEFRAPGSCRAIVLQASLWRVSPLFVLQSAYQAKPGGPIGYEAKLIHGVILANAPLSRRPRLQYGYSDPTKRTGANRFAKATAWVIGEDEPFFITTPTVSQIKVKNSPLWFSDVDMQLGYYAFRNLARLHFPDVLGGAYTREEVQQLRDLDGLENARSRRLFEEDEPIEADFEDSVPPSDQDAANFARAEAKASGAQDSRDPRDAPQNRPNQQRGPAPPPQGSQEPEDLSAAREWLMGEQKRLLALPEGSAISAGWSEVVKDERIGRIKAYAQPVFNAVKASIQAKVAELKGSSS